MVCSKIIQSLMNENGWDEVTAIKKVLESLGVSHEVMEEEMDEYKEAKLQEEMELKAELEEIEKLKERNEFLKKEIERLTKS